ncbi:hypothetical protein Tco_0904355 [Tanacetum coccineum]
MTSHRSKSLYAIKEFSICGRLYTKECCSIGSLGDKILVPKPDSSPCCARCGTPVNGPSCRGCAFLRKKFDEDLLAYCDENGIFQDFQDTSESSDDNTNVVNTLREPFVVNQDPGVKSSQDPPQIDHNCMLRVGPNGKVIYKLSIMNGPYLAEIKQMKQMIIEIQTFLLGLPERHSMLLLKIVVKNCSEVWIAQPGMNMGQDRQMRMVGANGGNQFRQYAGQNNKGMLGYQNGIMQYRLSGIGLFKKKKYASSRIRAFRVQIIGQSEWANWCQNIGMEIQTKEEGDADYLLTQLFDCSKEEAGESQLKRKTSISGTQMTKLPSNDSDGSVGTTKYDNCYVNGYLMCVLKEEQYTEKLNPFSENHTKYNRMTNVISDISGVEPKREGTDRSNIMNC